MSKAIELNKVKTVCKKCFDCELSKTRTNIVFSDGNPEAKIVIVGEAPGKNEDETGKPFVGRAGKLLDELFLSQGLTREKDFYICNTVKCRPPDNRVPTDAERAACEKFLLKQLDILQPKIIVLCGATALKAFLGNKTKISEVRGKWLGYQGKAKIMPVFHPSYLLRNPSLKKDSPKWLMLQDIKEIKRELQNII